MLLVILLRGWWNTWLSIGWRNLGRGRRKAVSSHWWLHELLMWRHWWILVRRRLWGIRWRNMRLHHVTVRRILRRNWWSWW